MKKHPWVGAIPLLALIIVAALIAWVREHFGI